MEFPVKNTASLQKRFLRRAKMSANLRVWRAFRILKIIGGCHDSVADLRPRSSKVFGYVEVFQRGKEASADRMSVNPQGECFALRKRIFGGFRFLDGCAVKQNSEGGVHPGKVSGFVDLLNTIPTFCSPFRRTA
ncbi:MAG: hypothetical protein IJQ39_03470 [Thermoguttaceae bacterium]|nr:hypothetical protein [Thermoguttaceae bacterium]